MLLSDFGPVVKTDLPPPPPIVDVAANDAISVLMHRYDVRSRGSLTSETARLIRRRISSLSPPAPRAVNAASTSYVTAAILTAVDVTTSKAQR